jgi:glycosyltransferase involved in cell wall biosynthesis
VTTVSVAIATYNGEQYLLAQLRSISMQTLPPNEIVICDDASTDKTIELAEGFAKDVAFEVKIIKNQANLGPAKTFFNAMANCSGDLIALSDQDDIWAEKKLEKCVREFERNPYVNLVAHRSVPVSSDLRPLKISSLEKLRFNYYTGKNTTYSPKSFPLGVGRAGHCIVLRRWLSIIANPACLLDWNLNDDWEGIITKSQDLSYGNEALNLFYQTVDAVGYDNWLVFVGSSIGYVKFISDELTLYRRHENTHTLTFRTSENSNLLQTVKTPVVGAKYFEHRVQIIESFLNYLDIIAKKLPKKDFDNFLAVSQKKYQNQLQAFSKRRNLYKSQSRLSYLKFLTLNILQCNYGKRSAGKLGVTALVRDILMLLTSTNRRNEINDL